MNIQELAIKNRIYEVVTGSHAYGTNIATSDKDTRGLFIAPKEILVADTFRRSKQNKTREVSLDGEDSKLYELKNFLQLLIDQNPNIIELLWIPEDLILYKHPCMDLLLKNRHLLLSKKCKHTFSGYAFAQLKRIKGHSKWIQNPQPKEPPQLYKFIQLITSDGIHIPYGEKSFEFFKNLTATRINDLTYCLWEDASGKLTRGFLQQEDQTTPSFIDIDHQKLKEINPKFVGTALIALPEYKEQMQKHKQYWEWKNNRNETRASLEEQHGLDTKHALHLVRLLTMGAEILRGEGVLVRRPDAQYLLDIRNGKISYEELIALAEQKDAEIQALYEVSPLPYSVDFDLVVKIYEQMQDIYYTGNA